MNFFRNLIFKQIRNYNYIKTIKNRFHYNCFVNDFKIYESNKFHKLFDKEFLNYVNNLPKNNYVYIRKSNCRNSYDGYFVDTNFDLYYRISKIGQNNTGTICKYNFENFEIICWDMNYYNK